MSKKAWGVVAGIVLFLAFIGLVIASNIVQTEGLEGLWKRKKDFVKDIHPGAGPVLDEAEKRVRGEQGAKR